MKNCVEESNSFSYTTTSFYVPANLADVEIIKKLKIEYKILIAGSYGEFKGRLLRIEHMGKNCTRDNIEKHCRL